MFTVKNGGKLYIMLKEMSQESWGRETLLTPMAFSCKIKNFFSRVALRMTVLYLFSKLVLGGSSHLVSS